MSATVVETGTHKIQSASGQVLPGRGQLLGVFCGSSTSAVIKIWDNPAATGTVVVEALGMISGTFYPIPATCANGCYITLVSGTGSWTAFYINAA